MRLVFGLTILGLAVPSACSRHDAGHDRPAAAATPEPPGPPVVGGAAAPFALVELFTSEGCSSCPPADRNLARIARDAERDGTNVVVLSFHVDYWNYIGWADPFSSARFSERQRRHAAELGGGVFTPELVLNGREKMVGSDENGADSAIARALGRAAPGAITLDPRRVGADRVDVAYAVRAAAGEHEVCVASAWAAGGVHVTRGENSGATLSHENVVRALECAPLGPDGRGVETVALVTPSPKRARLVAWVEDRRSLEVVALASAPLPDAVENSP